MSLIIVPFLAIAVLVAGIVLIVKRKNAPWYLWVGISLVVLFILTLPLTLPFAALGLLLLTGGSFS